MNSNDTYNSTLPEPLDYEQLKEYGLEYIRSIANKQWTDYNLHDPGVTILEALCFSLTDLAFRTRFSIADHLTPEGESLPHLDGTLFPAQEILSHEPISINDYKKFILEYFPGVRNVEIHTDNTCHLRTPGISTYLEEKNIEVHGYYKFALELEDEPQLIANNLVRATLGHDENWRYSKSFYTKLQDTYKNHVRNLYLKHRNLCEDLREVTILSPIHIGLHAEIEIEKSANVPQMKAIMRDITKQVGEYISPTIKRYTLPEMLKKGKTPEEIYQGILPRIGFVDMDELEHYQKRNTIHISDILNIIMKIKGVVGIRELYFIVDDKDQDKLSTTNSNGLCTSVSIKEKYKNDYTLFLSPYGTTKKADSHYFFVRDGFTFHLDPKDQLPLDAETNAFKNPDTDIPLSESKHRDTKTYYSFQHLFPKAYCMGAERISNNASNKRKAERLQLKAYLTFFDQLLADYLEQLSSMEQYFSVNPVDCSLPADLSYFFHELNEKEIVDVKTVLKDWDEKTAADIESRRNEINLERRNRLMDHLLARFNDSFVDYSVLSFLNSPKDGNQSYLKSFNEREELEDKKRLLLNFAQLSYHRSQAIDYTETVCLSGMERQILAKLGVNEPKFDIVPPVLRTYRKKNGKTKRYFKNNSHDPYDQTFGLHIVEHSLLLPLDRYTPDGEHFLRIKAENSNQLLEDPYSFHITVLVPGWLEISQNMEFRKFVENTIHNEIPAHVIAKICWVDPMVMWNFENSYRAFVEAMKQRPLKYASKPKHPTQPDGKWQPWSDCLKELLDVFNSFRNIYSGLVVPSADDLTIENMPRLDFMILDEWYDDEDTEEWAFLNDNK